MSAYKCVRCGVVSYHLVQTPTGLMHKSCWAREQAEAAAEGEQTAPPQPPLNAARPATRDDAFFTAQDLVVGFDEADGVPVLVVDPVSGLCNGLVPKARYRLTREAAAEVGARLLAASVDPQELRKQFTEALVQKALKESP